MAVPAATGAVLGADLGADRRSGRVRVSDLVLPRSGATLFRFDQGGVQVQTARADGDPASPASPRPRRASPPAPRAARPRSPPAASPDRPAGRGRPLRRRAARRAGRRVPGAVHPRLPGTGPGEPAGAAVLHRRRSAGAGSGRRSPRAPRWVHAALPRGLRNSPRRPPAAGARLAARPAAVPARHRRAGAGAGHAARRGGRRGRHRRVPDRGGRAQLRLGGPAPAPAGHPGGRPQPGPAPRRPAAGAAGRRGSRATGRHRRRPAARHRDRPADRQRRTGPADCRIALAAGRSASRRHRRRRRPAVARHLLAAALEGRRLAGGRAGGRGGRGARRRAARRRGRARTGARAGRCGRDPDGGDAALADDEIPPLDPATVPPAGCWVVLRAGAGRLLWADGGPPGPVAASDDGGASWHPATGAAPALALFVDDPAGAVPALLARVGTVTGTLLATPGATFDSVLSWPAELLGRVSGWRALHLPGGADRSGSSPSRNVAGARPIRVGQRRAPPSAACARQLRARPGGRDRRRVLPAPLTGTDAARHESYPAARLDGDGVPARSPAAGRGGGAVPRPSPGRPRKRDRPRRSRCPAARRAATGTRTGGGAAEAARPHNAARAARLPALVADARAERTCRSASRRSRRRSRGATTCCSGSAGGLPPPLDLPRLRLEAAEAVVEADLEELATLVDASLLKSRGDSRFLMLETIREFARARLPSADATRLPARHAQRYLALAEAAAPT